MHLHLLLSFIIRCDPVTGGPHTMSQLQLDREDCKRRWSAIQADWPNQQRAAQQLIEDLLAKVFPEDAHSPSNRSTPQPSGIASQRPPFNCVEWLNTVKLHGDCDLPTTCTQVQRLDTDVKCMDFVDTLGSQKQAGLACAIKLGHCIVRWKEVLIFFALMLSFTANTQDTARVCCRHITSRGWCAREKGELLLGQRVRALSQAP